MPRVLAARNPFRYGDVATGSSFTDREAELRDLESDIRSGQNVLVLSPRRYGKTSLVTEAVRLLRDQQVLVAYVDLLRATSKPELAGKGNLHGSRSREHGQCNPGPHLVIRNRRPANAAAPLAHGPAWSIS